MANTHIDGTVGYICTVPMVYEPFVLSMVQLVQYNAHEGLNIYYNRTTVGSQANARNHLVKSMQGHWLFFVDTDIVFPYDTLSKLLKIQKKNNLDVLSGIYYQRQAPHYPVVYQSQNDEIWNCEVKFDRENIAEVYGVGGGCLLVKKKVFDRIQEELKEEPFDIIGSSGEDISFCRRLNKLGIKVHVTNEIPIGHLHVAPVVKQHFDLSQPINETTDLGVTA